MIGKAVIPNPAREKPLSLAKLAKRIEVSRSTIWRWTTRGSLGVVLETMQLGGRRYTSEEAWVRFCRRQQQAALRIKGEKAEASPAEAIRPLSQESMQKLIAAGLVSAGVVSVFEPAPQPAPRRQEELHAV